MTIALLKMLIWGVNDVGDKGSIEHESDDIIEDVDEDMVNIENENENENENETENENENEEILTDEETDKLPAVDIEAEINSRSVFRDIILLLYALQYTLLAGITTLTIYEGVLENYYNTSKSMVVYNEPVIYGTPQTISRLPYIPLFLLGIHYLYPEMLVVNNGSTIYRVNATNTFLWLQCITQLFVSFGKFIGDIPFEMTNIALGLSMLYLFFILTTNDNTAGLINMRRFYTLSSLIICGRWLYGMTYTFFLGFSMVVSTGPFLKNSFELINSHGMNLLYYTGSVTFFVYVCYMFSSSFEIIANIFVYQIFGSVIDLILVSPKPGKYWVVENENEDSDLESEDISSDDE